MEGLKIYLNSILTTCGSKYFALEQVVTEIIVDVYGQERELLVGTSMT